MPGAEAVVGFQREPVEPPRQSLTNVVDGVPYPSQTATLNAGRTMDGLLAPKMLSAELVAGDATAVLFRYLINFRYDTRKRAIVHQRQSSQLFTLLRSFRNQQVSGGSASREFLCYRKCGAERGT